MADPQVPQIYRDFFTYTTGRFAVAAAAQVTQNINIQADADFEILKLTFFNDVAAAAQTQNTLTMPNMNILITDTGSGRQLMNVAVAITSIFGTGQMPFILPAPRKIAARSTLQVVVTSFEAANTNNVSINFIGNKVFQLA